MLLSAWPVMPLSARPVMLLSARPVMSACGRQGGSSKLCTRLNFHWPIRWYWDNSFQFHSWLQQPMRVSDQSSESIWKGRHELNLSYLDASQDTELTLNCKWHSTGSQVTCKWHSRETWSSAKVAVDPPHLLHTTHRRHLWLTRQRGAGSRGAGSRAMEEMLAR